MPHTNTTKLVQRDQLRSLFDTIRSRLAHVLLKDIAEETGIPPWQMSRLLAQGVASPTYVDMTRLITRAGLTPNEAAALAGLYTEVPDAEKNPSDDPVLSRAVQALADPTLDTETRERAVLMLETYLQAERLRARGTPQEHHSKYVSEIEPGTRRNKSRAKIHTA